MNIQSLAKVLKIVGASNQIELSSMSLGDGSWDSFAHVELIDALEELGKSELSEEDFRKVESGIGVLAFIADLG